MYPNFNHMIPIHLSIQLEPNINVDVLIDETLHQIGTFVVVDNDDLPPNRKHAATTRATLLNKFISVKLLPSKNNFSVNVH